VGQSIARDISGSLINFNYHHNNNHKNNCVALLYRRAYSPVIPASDRDHEGVTDDQTSQIAHPACAHRRIMDHCAGRGKPGARRNSSSGGEMNEHRDELDKLYRAASLAAWGCGGALAQLCRLGLISSKTAIETVIEYDHCCALIDEYKRGTNERP
jgi:hypothetical protein